MKKKLNKIISAILILASLISVLSIFVYAEDIVAEPEGEDSGSVNIADVEIVYNRTFEDGWEYNNGFSTFWTDSKSKNVVHKSYVDFEVTPANKYNYFWRMEATDSTQASASTLEIDTIRESGTVVELKIKADDACNLGRILYMTTSKDSTVDILSISKNTLYAFKTGKPEYKVGDLTNEWLSVKLVFDWDATKTLSDGSAASILRCRVYYGDEGKYFDYEADYSKSGDIGMKSLSFGFAAAATDRNGMSICVDDVRVYQKVKQIIDFTDIENYGIKVNTLAAATVDIQEGPGNKSTDEIINEALCLKVGVDSALVRNNKQSIADYCTPEIVDGNVMIPLSLFLEFINYPYYIHGESYDITTGTSATYITIGRDTANVDGVRIDLSVAPGYLTNAKGEQIPVIATQDIPKIFPGWLLMYDDMGLIIIYSGEASENGEALITRENDLDLMLTIMKKFVFNTVTEDENGKEFVEVEDSYIATGNKVLADVKKHSVSHPYIFTNQETFDKLSAMYSATENADTKVQGYLQTLISEAEAVYVEYTGVSSAVVDYEGILEGKEPINVYGDGKNPDPNVLGDPTVADTTDGYTAMGTLESVKLYSEHLVKLAFAYQINGNTKYADLALDISLALGEWTHWGPADIESCATATGNFAIAFDWLYNYYADKTITEIADNPATPEEETVQIKVTDKLSSILYNKGVKHGYNSSAGKFCEFPKASGGGDVYTTDNTYLNAVCSANMIIGALALADYADYSADSAFLIGSSIQNLIANGLDQYAPDGSYAESALMWADATNAFVKLIMALESAAGTTYGFEGTWGLDKTFYFACYIEDSDGKIWNYHEGGADGVVTGPISGIDTQMFNYAGKFLNDSNLLAIRNKHLESGKPVSMFDMLFYPQGNVEEERELSLDYQMEGIHAFVSRSDWEKGALYTGIMGGSNSVYGGQLDSGNFIYRNEGIDWIIDLGSDNEQIYSYNGAYRNHHYRHNAEGQNVIVFTTAQNNLPYGQLATGNGQITKTGFNEHGSFAVLQNKSAYGSTVSYANRGLLITNDRKTVVVQDELSLPRFQDLTWIVHTASNIEIDKSGKIAYLTDTDAEGNTHILRVTIVSNGDYSFKTETAEAGKVLDATYKSSDYKKNGDIQPYSRSGIKRLVIKTRNTLIFNMAVAFEIVSSKESAEPVGYNWSFMSMWNPSVAGEEQNTETAIYRDSAVKSDIISEGVYLNMYTEILNTAYTENINEFFYSLTKVAYTLKAYPLETLDTTELTNAYSAYENYLNSYENYIKKINAYVESSNNLMRSMTGIKTEK